MNRKSIWKDVHVYATSALFIEMPARLTQLTQRARQYEPSFHCPSFIVVAGAYLCCKCKNHADFRSET